MDFIFVIPIWIIIGFLLCGFVFGKMVMESLVSVLGIIFTIVAGILIIIWVLKRIRQIMYDRSSDDDWSWEDN